MAHNRYEGQQAGTSKIHTQQLYGPSILHNPQRQLQRNLIDRREICSCVACRKDDWKIIFIPKAEAADRCQLYDNLTPEPDGVRDGGTEAGEFADSHKDLVPVCFGD
jgi:hypothetical protein